MTAGRVDQTDVPGTLRDHRERIRALEALSPASAGGCAEFVTWGSVGSSSFSIVTGGSACTPVVSQPTAGFDGVVWACSPLDSDPPPPLVQGSFSAVIGDPGSAAPGDCGDDFFNYYAIVPPFVSDEITAPMPVVSTGFGYTIQQSTRTAIPVQLVWQESTGFGWGIMVPGTELQNAPGGTNADGWNLARPTYPFEYASGDTLFTGTFIYNPVSFA